MPARWPMPKRGPGLPAAGPARIIFLDFEASSLGRRGFPIEVAWVFETGEAESYLIRPAEDWTEWAAEAEAVHSIRRVLLEQGGTPAMDVARRVLDALSGHRLYVSAPSWDGQWLSRLLRAGGLPRHALRLRDTEEAQAEAAAAELAAAGLPVAQRGRLVEEILGEARRRAAEAPPAHRALEDARREIAIWQEVRRLAEEAAARQSWPPHRDGAC
jgi:hypothetical protein